MTKERKLTSLKLAIASGKGGVGKSMIASALAMLFSKERKIVAVDCDVDAPNLHLWLGLDEKWETVEKISTNEKLVIDRSKCDLCGKCVNICTFDALSFVALPTSEVKSADTSEVYKRLELNKFFCEGCGACEVICPQKAIKLKPVRNAEIKIRKSCLGFPLVSAQLYPGEVGSGKVVELIKERANDFPHEMMILDAPAGTGCPVIATLKDAHFVVLVTEPTPSGFSDLQRVFEVVEFFNLRFGIIVNKWDINPSQAARIRNWSGKDFLGQISYDQKIFSAIANLIPILKTDLKAKDELKKFFDKVSETL